LLTRFEFQVKQLNLIYKILNEQQWNQFQASSLFEGSPIDIQDGFIHFSGGPQVAQTANKHFANQTDLYLLTVDGDHCGPNLRWEVSRGGDLFPHLYGKLALSQVISWRPFRQDKDGLFQFSEQPAAE